MEATCFFRGGTSHPHCVRAILPPKQHSKPSQPPFSTFFHPKSTKVRAFSVRACGSADNDKLLPSDVRKRSIDAIDSSGRRVNFGDVVSKGSFKSSQAQIALQALAADTNGRSQVSGIKMLEKGKVAAAFLMRVSFWASLAASSVVGFAFAIQVTLVLRVFKSSQANRLDHFICDVSNDLLSGKLVDRVFSYVFGDGDPNHGIEEKKWKMIGEYIALNGGVVTAEELAPYLDPAIVEKMKDELYMLPVLQRFDGQPKVDEEGNILYHFPLVHCTPPPRRMSGVMEHVGRFVDWDMKVDKFLKENKWKFSKLDPEEIHSLSRLLQYNGLCVSLSGIRVRKGVDFLLVPISSFYVLFFPLLLMYVIYATLFLLIGLKRPSSIEKINAEIAERNKARRQRAKALESPNPSLKRKLLSARAMAQRISEGNERIVYNSESDLCEQHNCERQEWNRRFLTFELNKV